MKKLSMWGFGVLALAACQPQGEPAPAATEAAPAPVAISTVSAASNGPWMVKIDPVAGGTIAGELRLARVNDEVRITGEIHGLAANSEHGIHIHENGSCANNADAAGAHWNPTAHNHGGATGEERHAGDMGNLKSDAKGAAVVDVAVAIPADAVVEGRAVIVHAKVDDMKTQPSGNSGARAGCGVISPAM